MVAQMDADVIVVGAGPAGAACALRLAQTGRSVILLERGETPGSKNVTGGRLYTAALDMLSPGLAAEAPAERHVTSERISILDGEAHADIHVGLAPCDRSDSITVNRSALDPWLAGCAEEAGAMVVPGMTVDGLVMNGNRVEGIRAGEDELHAEYVVAADGVNSLLAASAGLTHRPRPGEVATGVKVTVGLPEHTINERFAVSSAEGAAHLMLGCTNGARGGGFLYTNRESLSIGIVVDPTKLPAVRSTPRELLESLLRHPLVEPFVRGGELREYSAHLVREDGRSGIPPQLTLPGFLVAGEAAGFCLNLGYTIRGMDVALLSGIAAAEAIGADTGDLEGSYRTALAACGATGIMDAASGYGPFLDKDRLYGDYPKLAMGIARDVFAVANPPQAPDRIVPSVRREFRSSPLRIRDLVSDARAAVKGL